MASGQIGWVELHVEDAETSAKFYESAFDWQIQRDPNMPEYIMWRDSGGQLGGGFTASMRKATGQIYLMSDDIEQSLKAVEAAGGKQVKEKTLITEEIGYWGQFEDPAGNVMGLFQTAQ